MGGGCTGQASLPSGRVGDIGGDVRKLGADAFAAPRTMGCQWGAESISTQKSNRRISCIHSAEQADFGDFWLRGSFSFPYLFKELETVELGAGAVCRAAAKPAGADLRLFLPCR